MQNKRSSGGFTLMELIIVLVIISLMATISVPVITTSVKRADESALKETLAVTRKALDDYYADHGNYPSDLNELVGKKYLRSMPFDPVLDSNDAWELVMSDDGESGIMDIKSSSPEQARDGTFYNEW